MHELAIANNLFDLCLKNAAENSAIRINKVTVKIGKLSGIEPHYLVGAFDIVKNNSIVEDAELEIIHQDVILHCTKCNKDTTLIENNFSCPFCESIDVEVIDGEDMVLMSLELEQ